MLHNLFNTLYTVRNSEDRETNRKGRGGMRAEELSGIILAGGRSTRMGRNKALLEVGGTPLLRHLAEAMLELGMKRVLVASGTEERAGEYGALLQGLPGEVDFVADQYPDCGPLAGLHAALTAMPESGYGFAMACDMPVLSASLFERLREAVGDAGHLAEEASGMPEGDAPGAASTSEGDASGAASMSEGDAAWSTSMLGGETPEASGLRVPQLISAAGQPLHALYRASAAGELRRRLERGDLRMMPLLGALRSIELTPTPDEEAAFLNLNTPELYERYIRLGEQL